MIFHRKMEPHSPTEAVPPPVVDDGLAEQVRATFATLKQHDDLPRWLEPLLMLLMGMFEQLFALLAHQRAENERLAGENAEHRRARFGRKSEKMPPIAGEVRKAKDAKPRAPRTGPAALDKAALTEEPVEHVVSEEDAHCPCGDNADWKDLNSPETSSEYEYRAARLVRRRHRRQKLCCAQCGAIVTAPSPAKVVDGGRFGPGLHAHTVVSRCIDAMPLHRQAERWQRTGAPLSDSTLGDLLHRTAELVRPLWDALREAVRRAPHVHADETPQPVLGPGKTERGYMWIFATTTLALYVFARDRSGQTPLSVLGGTVGELKVDGYSGYNKVSTPEGRTRSGCIGHARRKVFDARATAPEIADEALVLIRELYRVEADARERRVLGTPEHLALRRRLSRPITQQLRTWLDREQPRHHPKGPLGKALGYMDKQWDKLMLFLEDPLIDLDNNEAERLLRRVALGRKTSLFVGPGDDNGEHLAILLSLCMTCRLNGVDPEVYLIDVLLRLQTWPASRIDELLPHNWSPEAAAVAP